MNKIALSVVLILLPAFGAHGQVLTTLHSFDGTDGSSPAAGLIQTRDGSFVGTTAYGGAAGDTYQTGNGTIFQIAPGGAFSTLYAFEGIDDGANPFASLMVGSDGNFHGTTPSGGIFGHGSIFTLTPSGDFTPSDFSFPDSSNPTSALIQTSNGNYFGTSSGGGVGNGTVLEISNSGLGALHVFAGPDGTNPNGVIQGTDGNLYGTTVWGGAGGSLGGDGTIYRLTPDGGLTTLYSFNGQDGQSPNGVIQGTDGNFYGTTAFGGTGFSGGISGAGTVFRMTPTGALSTLYMFTGNSDGDSPFAGLIQGTDGNFYGTTINGGLGGGAGTVFRITPSGALTTLHSFNFSDGLLPVSSLVQGADGNLYGATEWGGAGGSIPGDGTVFKLTLNPPSHVLWSSANGALSLWNYAPSTGAYTVNSYGPFAGWTANAVTDGPDGLTRVLWVSKAGAASIWSVDGTTGNFTQNTFGPYTGWTPTSLSVSGNNTTHILWTDGGTASVWSYSGTSLIAQQNFGPFTGWTATAIADGPDGMTRLLWNDGGGSASIWSLDSYAGSYTENAFGPYPGWSAKAISVNSANTTNLLWTSSNGAASLWNFDAAGTISLNSYGPVTSWTPVAIADEPNDNTQIVWDGDSGAASIWDQDNETGTFTQKVFGPFDGWTAIALSATSQ